MTFAWETNVEMSQKPESGLSELRSSGCKAERRERKWMILNHGSALDEVHGSHMAFS